MVETRHFRSIERGYSRTLEKVITQSAVEHEYFDPAIPNEDVGGGDPGLAQLMQMGEAELGDGPAPTSPFEQLRDLH